MISALVVHKVLQNFKHNSGNISKSLFFFIAQWLIILRIKITCVLRSYLDKVTEGVDKLIKLVLVLNNQSHVDE